MTHEPPDELWNRIVAVSKAAAKSTWQDRGHGEFWLDHMTLGEQDVARLAPARDLTMWNVKVPEGFYRRLPALEILDLRGGSGTNIDAVAEASGLKHLTVNQVRGIRDVDAVAQLPNLESLVLYGLPQLERLPSFARLHRLRMLQLGSMRSFRDLRPVAEAPALEELRFVRKIGVDAEAMKVFLGHPTLQYFDWFREDVPDSKALPVLAVLGLPKPPSW